MKIFNLKVKNGKIFYPIAASTLEEAKVFASELYEIETRKSSKGVEWEVLTDEEKNELN